MNKKIFLLLLFPLIFMGCKKYDISISQHTVNRDYLASSHVNTPDPRQEDPPFGEMLSIDWVVPRELLTQTPQLVLNVIYKNYEQETFCFPILKRRDYVTVFLLNEEFEEKKGFLTYKAHIVTADGSVYREWIHQMWVNLITLDECLPQPDLESSNNSSEEESSSCVIDHPIQGSVTDMP